MTNVTTFLDSKTKVVENNFGTFTYKLANPGRYKTKLKWRLVESELKQPYKDNS